MINISGFLGVAIPILIFLCILGVVIAIHEFGHFIMARRCGIFVEEFALGMGPKLIAIRGKKEAKYIRPNEENVTLYTLRLFPIGGFCRMRGMDESADSENAVQEDTDAMYNKTVWQRMLVIVGGSLMNFLLGFILFLVLTMLQGYSTTDIRRFHEGSPAQQAGIQVGDRITHIDGSRVTYVHNYQFMLELSNGQPVEVRVDRNGQALDFVVTPMNVADLFFDLGAVLTRRAGFLNWNDPYVQYRITFAGTIINAGESIMFNVRAPFRILMRFVRRQHIPEDAGLMGPIGMGGAVTQIYQQSMEHRGVLETALTMFMFMAIINVALGLMNMLPIPALDGARLVFLSIEAVRRKPIAPEREGMVHFVGLVVLLVLAVFIAYQDIVNLL